MTPKEFASEMRKLSKGIEVNVDKAKRATALKILTDVTLATPVKSGRARANWIASIGSSAQFTVEWPETGAESKAYSYAISAGNAVIATSVPKRSIYVQNNLPYIGRLNDGWSKQAPSNFVQRAIQSAVLALKKAKIL